MAAALLPSACRAPSPEYGEGMPGGSPLRHARPVDGRVLWPRQNAARIYAATVNGHGTDPIQVSVASHADGWRETVGRASATIVTPLVDGSRETREEHDLRNQVVVRYEPALPLMPARLVLNEPTEGEVAVTVTSAADGAPRDAGACRYSIVLAGRQRVETPAGTFDALIVRTQRDLDLRFANATVTWWSAHVLNRGMVARHQVEEVRIMNLIPTRRVTDLRLSQ